MTRPVPRRWASAVAVSLAAAAALAPGTALPLTPVRSDPPPVPTALRTRAVWDREALESAGIHGPERLLYAPDGTLYVLDAESRRIVALDPRGRALRSMGGYGADEASLNLPVDLLLDARGSLLVLDRARGEIVAFDSAGRFLTSRSLADEALDEGRQSGARLLRDPFGTLWLLCPSARDVMPLDDRLGPARISRFLEPRDSLRAPTLAAFAPSGDVWVYDAGVRALRKFDSGGRLLFRVSAGDSLSPAPEPASLAPDPSGAVFVADPSGRRILVLTTAGQTALTRAMGGGDRGFGPTALAVGPGGLLAAADIDRDEIRILSIEREEAP